MNLKKIDEKIRKFARECLLLRLILEENKAIYREKKLKEQGVK